MSTIHVGTFAEPDPARALARLAGAEGEAVALIADPLAYTVARLDEAGAPHGPDGQAVSLAGTFDVRAFDGRCEVRWLREPRGAGRAAVVSETPLGDAPTPVPVRCHVDRTEIVWGRVTSSEGGWVRTHEDRIGELALPVEVAEAGGGVALRVREYLADGGAALDGNTVIGHERIVGFEGVW